MYKRSVVDELQGGGGHRDGGGEGEDVEGGGGDGDHGGGGHSISCVQQLGGAAGGAGKEADTENLQPWHTSSLYPVYLK